MIISKLAVILSAATSAFTRDMNAANAKIKEFGRTADTLGDKIGRMGRTMTFAMSIPLATISVFAVKSAIAAEDISDKFDEVFSSLPEGAKKMADSFSRNYGVASSTSKKLLGDTGDLLEGFGVSEKAALKMSERINQLAKDLDSFRKIGGGIGGASESLTRGILGQTIALRSLGIFIKEVDVKRQMLLNTTRGMVFASEREARAQAILQLAYERSGRAVGAYSRNRETLKESVKTLMERLKDLNEQWGRFLIDTLHLDTVLKQVNDGLQKLNDWMKKLSESARKIIVTLAAIAIIAPPVAWLVWALKMVGIGKLFAWIEYRAYMARMSTRKFYGVIGLLGVGFYSLISLINSFTLKLKWLPTLYEKMPVSVRKFLDKITFATYAFANNIVQHLQSFMTGLWDFVKGIGAMIEKEVKHIVEMIQHPWNIPTLALQGGKFTLPTLKFPAPDLIDIKKGLKIIGSDYAQLIKEIELKNRAITKRGEEVGDTAKEKTWRTKQFAPAGEMGSQESYRIRIGRTIKGKYEEEVVKGVNKTNTILKSINKKITTPQKIQVYELAG